MTLFKDIEKDVTGNAKDYKYPLPWIPFRANDQGIFYTKIPTDLVEILLNYVQYARVTKDNISSSFYNNIEKMNIEICMAYSLSFLYLELSKLLKLGYLKFLFLF